jgi:hypothetical protein
VRALQWTLYRSFYCMGRAMRRGWEPGNPVLGRTRFVQRLSAANSGRGYWDGAWKVVIVEGGTAVVEKEGLSLWVNAEDCSPQPPRDSSATGNRVSVRYPMELLRISPGFYTALGDVPLSEAAPDTIVRLYWNVRAGGATSLVRSVTRSLNELRVPFRLKVLNDPAAFGRCDSAVTYLPRAVCAGESSWIAERYAELSGRMRRSTPVFTKRLAPGLGLAEDPGGGESFGLHRCRLLAEGLVRAYERGERSTKARMEVVRERFSEEGISPTEPFLSPGARDGYSLHLPPKNGPGTGSADLSRCE